MKTRTKISLIALLLLAAALSWWLWTDGEKSSAPPVETMAVSSQPAPEAAPPQPEMVALHDSQSLTEDYSLAPWQTMDIGAVEIAGGANERAGTFTVRGSGLGLAGTSDQFRYVYQTMSGDGSITARVVSQSGNTNTSLAGVMVRETTAPGSAFAAVCHRGSGANTMSAVRRTTTGGLATSTSSASLTPPNCWVRVTRTGNSFAMASSPGGKTWTAINASTISMATDVTVGLIVTSGNNTVRDSDLFDSGIRQPDQLGGNNTVLDTDVLDNVTVVP